MATIRKLSGKWQAQIRRKGYPATSRTFTKHSDALEWARQMDRRADRKDLDGITCPDAKHATVHDLIEKYLTEIMPSKLSQEVQTYILRRFQQHSLAKKHIQEITAQDFAAYKEERLLEISATTFNHQLGIIQHAFETAIKEWNWPLRNNPLKFVRRPKNDPNRTRRLSLDEERQLLKEIENTRNPHIKPIFLFALATAMRRGELLRIKWTDINFTTNTLHIPVTKNGHPRTIPLSTHALAVLNGLSRKEKQAFVFPVSDNALKLAWQRLRDRTGIDDLHFHDLRHEAITRLVERGLTVPEVALISGHRDYRMLFRYTHLKAESLVEKLG